MERKLNMLVNGFIFVASLGLDIFQTNHGVALRAEYEGADDYPRQAAIETRPSRPIVGHAHIKTHSGNPL